MMIGKYFTENLLQEWYLRELENARKVLRQFPLLNQLFDEFNDYEKKQYSETRNIVLISCLSDFKGNIKQNTIKSLAQMEDSINLFNIINWSMANYNQFKSRFCNDNYYTSISAYTELLAAKYLTERIGKDNIALYPKLKGGGLSDVLAKVNGRSIYIEIGNLTESKPEKKIQQILDASAKHIGEKLDTNCNCCLQINVDTAEFVVDDKERIDVSKSILKLNSEIDKYGVHKLAGFKGFITLDKFVSIIEESKKITLLPPNIEESLNSIKDSKIKDWIDYSNLGKLGSTQLIKSIGGEPLSTTLVEIHPEGFCPSKAAKDERKSFINRIIKIVEEQLKEEQIQSDEPNIIIVQGRNWTIWQKFEFELIGNRIQKFFEERKEKYLSGIAVFEDFDNVMYVDNKYVEASSKLNQSEVNQLGFKWETC